MTELNGILCIDKPAGFTSFDVVAKMRKIAKTRKIGHAGTLDPMATGVLPLFFGRATKACGLLPASDKRYLAELRLGVETDTLDITGTVLRERRVEASEEQIRLTAARFTGEILQVPPMYSALKVGGKKLCDLARQGIEVERKPRPVTIYTLDFLSYDPQEQLCRMDVHCSKGTYIRTLAADIGAALGCGAALTMLRRTMAAGFGLESCVTLEQAQAFADEGRLEELILPVEQAFSGLPRACLSQTQARMFCNGVCLDSARVRCPGHAGILAVYGEARFLGLAELKNGQLKMIKLFAAEG